MNKLEATIDTLQIKVEADASKALKQLGQLTSHLTKLQQIKEPTNIEIKTGSSISNLNSLYTALMRVWGLLKKIRKNANLQINAEVILNTNGQTSPIAEGDANAPKTTAPFTANVEMPKAIKSINWDKLKDTFTAIQKSKVFSKIGDFGKSIKRIALYRIIRSIIKVIEQAIKEGTQNLYQYSKAINSTFSKSLDTLTTSFEYLKNSFITLFEPVINAITPFIEKLVDSIVEIFNKLSLVINKALGNDTWTKAIKYAKKYGDEVKKTVLSFDELNKMNGNEDDNPLMKFETKDIIKDEASEIEKITKKIQKYINAIVGILTGTAVGGFLVKLGKLLTALGSEGLGLGQIFSGAAGAGLSAFGIVSYITGLIEQIKNGEFSTDSLIELLKGELGIIGGSTLLGAAFGNPLLGAIIGVIVSGAGNIVAALADAITNKVTWENALLATGSMMAVGTMIGTLIAPGIGSLVGAGIGLIAGEVTTLALLIKDNWDNVIVPLFNDAKEGVTNVWNKLMETNDNILAWIKDIPNKVKRAIDDIGNWFGDLGNNLLKLNDDILADINSVLQTIGDNIKSFLEDPIKYIGNFFISVLNKIIGGFETTINGFIGGINKVIGTANEIGINITPITGVTISRIPKLANGGIIDEGQLFIANEREAEYISSYNGKTAVMNNEQIVRGIVDGVREAFRESDLGGNWTIQILDEGGAVRSETIISALERKNRRDGKTIVSVST